MIRKAGRAGKGQPMAGIENPVHALIGKLSAGAICLLGRSLSIRRIGTEYLEQAREGGRKVLYAFWHEGLIVATYAFRRQGIQVLVSQHRDGELIARAIESMGYGTIRGSSTRGERAPCSAWRRPARPATTWG